MAHNKDMESEKMLLGNGERRNVRQIVKGEKRWLQSENGRRKPPGRREGSNQSEGCCRIKMHVTSSYR